MILRMPAVEAALPAVDVERVRARAKVLARADRTMKAELVRLRRAAGLTQAQVAQIMGVTQQAVQKFERYDSDPKLSTLRRYTNAIGALVEHRVTADVGQSVPLASGGRWDAAVSSSRKVSAAPLSELHSVGMWVTASRRTFALAC